MNKWIKVFDNLELAFEKISKNQSVRVKIGSRNLSMGRFNDNLYAIDDRCPHNGESLSKGRINFLGEIICPWHNYRFHLHSGRECQERTKDLKTYPVDINEKGVFIKLTYE